ncbi:hypothetical protein H4R20_001107 [Coemansia guatemalensis]|uniref:Uncharacterized protein n=1 Tax=Coemansia guatemalensis TaxID=2761395 RepID=A0A9W8I073_9FUNG|nr:hypothetical protein H4R20_001107 [Coemansia guatemalensis]
MINATVVKESLQRRRSSNIIVAKTLMSMVWFPIVPILSLGFNTIYSIVWYRTQKESMQVAVVDEVLQFLAVPLFALTFYLNPSVKRALKQYLIDRRGTSTAPSLNETRRPSPRNCSSAMFNGRAITIDSTDYSSNEFENPFESGSSGFTTKLSDNSSERVDINSFLRSSL